MKQFVLFAGLAVGAVYGQTLTVPAGTTVSVTLTAPVWMNTARIGDGVYGEINFPVTADNRVAIAPGTKVQGTLEVICLPTKSMEPAEMRMSFSQMIFADGSAVTLDGTSTFAVVVSKYSDVLLDNGSQLEFTLGRDLLLNGPFPAVKPMRVESWKSATRCVPTPAVPAVEGTVIPGTPATPPTVIPQGDGLPDIVIPGSPGTPDQVVGGSSGSPAIPCPAPPSVSNAPLPHHESIRIEKPFHIGGLALPKGKYTLRWTGLGPATEVAMEGPHKSVNKVMAQVVGLPAASGATSPVFAAAGELRITAIRFQGKAFSLQFE